VRAGSKKIKQLVITGHFGVLVFEVVCGVSLRLLKCGLFSVLSAATEAGAA